MKTSIMVDKANMYMLCDDHLMARYYLPSLYTCYLYLTLSYFHQFTDDFGAIALSEAGHPIKEVLMNKAGSEIVDILTPAMIKPSLELILMSVKIEEAFGHET